MTAPTGCRVGEVVSLEWDWIKGKRILLPDSKSGPRTVWLPSAARAVIDAIPRYSEDCPFLFPARPATRPIDNFGTQWDRIRNEAGLPGLRIHDLRHSWASTAAMNGVDMVIIAKLLGHALVETTERYTHLSDQSVADAADRVSGRIHAALAASGAEHEGGTSHASVDLTPRLARESRPSDRDTILFDKSLPGFGLRIHPSGRKVWVVQARIEGRSRRIVIARHGEMELAQARRRARDLLGRIRACENPAEDMRREKEVPTLRQFAQEYLRRCDPHWKPSGRNTVRIYLKARILPAFGRMPLDCIGPEDVAAWFDAASRDRPGAANRAFEILRAMMFRAEEWSLRERGSNPCIGIAKNPKKNIAQFLDTDELARLGRALDARESEWPEAVAAIRLLALTGCRHGEVLSLRWRDIGSDAINLPETKTGPRTISLSPEAATVLSRIPQLPGNPYVIPRKVRGKAMRNLNDPWDIVCERTGLKDMRLHDCRHTLTQGDVGAWSSPGAIPGCDSPDLRIVV